MMNSVQESLFWLLRRTLSSSAYAAGHKSPATSIAHGRSGFLCEGPKLVSFKQARHLSLSLSLLHLHRARDWCRSVGCCRCCGTLKNIVMANVDRLRYPALGVLTCAAPTQCKRLGGVRICVGLERRNSDEERVEMLMCYNIPECA